jgi:hypothetical protein
MTSWQLFPEFNIELHPGALELRFTIHGSALKVYALYEQIVYKMWKPHSRTGHFYLLSQNTREQSRPTSYQPLTVYTIKSGKYE